MGDAPTISGLTSEDIPATSGAFRPGNAGQGGTLSQGGVPIAGINDLFAQLREFSWGGVPFPVADFENVWRQDLVVHKFADRNGAYVEGVGRHPLETSVTIPFLNNIYPAAGESWPQGNLYPYQLRFFLQQCLDPSSKTLVHPEFGPLNCKLDTARLTWSASRSRDGIWVRASFVESDDTVADQLAEDLSAQSPIAQLTSSADDLDQQTATLQAALDLQANPFGALGLAANPLSSLVAAVVGVVDIPTLLSKQYQGQLDNVVYQADRIEDAVSFGAAASPLTWPIFQNCERAKASAYALKAQSPVGQTTSQGTLTTYETRVDRTLSAVANDLGVGVESLILLNPALAGSPVVPVGTRLYYFVPEA